MLLVGGGQSEHDSCAILVPRALCTLGTPDWRHVERAHVEELIGEALRSQACVCRVTS